MVGGRVGAGAGALGRVSALAVPVRNSAPTRLVRFWWTNRLSALLRLGLVVLVSAVVIVFESRRRIPGFVVAGDILAGAAVAVLAGVVCALWGRHRYLRLGNQASTRGCLLLHGPVGAATHRPPKEDWDPTFEGRICVSSGGARRPPAFLEGECLPDCGGGQGNRRTYLLIVGEGAAAGMTERLLAEPFAMAPGVHLEQGAAEFGEAVRWGLEHAEHCRQFVVAESERAPVCVDGSSDVLGEAEVAGLMEQQRELCDGGARDLEPGDGHVARMPSCQVGKRLAEVAVVGAA
jgi:hypothetical protein